MVKISFSKVNLKDKKKKIKNKNLIIVQLVQEIHNW